MAERPTDRELVRRGREASQLLESGLLNQAFDALAEEFVTAWKTSKIGDAESREACYRMHTAIVEVRTRLTKYVEQGKVAAKLLEHQEKGPNGSTDRPQ